MKFRKKPVIIDAIQWNGNNIKEIKKFTNNKIIIEKKIGSSVDGNGYKQKYIKLIIPTLEGNHRALITDWIIKGIKGEFYPCKHDIFLRTYEKV